MTLITGTDFITVPTKDFEAAAAFYCDVLGLEEGKRWGRCPPKWSLGSAYAPANPGG